MCTLRSTSRWRNSIICCPRQRDDLLRRSLCRGVESLLRLGHRVHVVYEACGFGFTLYRQLVAVGAHGYVIAPCQLDERHTRVKTDPRDATMLCQRLSRYLEGNTRELAVIRVPTQAEEQARHITRQREQLVPSTPEDGSTGPRSVNQSRFAGPSPLVEKSDLESAPPTSPGVDGGATGSLSPGALDPAKSGSMPSPANWKRPLRRRSRSGWGS